MWKPNIRPHGESFALNQVITTTTAPGNQIVTNPKRLDQSQGGTAIRMVVPREAGSSLTVANGATITMTVTGAKTATDTAIVLGTAVYTNDTGTANVIGPDGLVLEYILSEVAFNYPYIGVTISGSAAPTGTIDIFPHQVSHPRR